MNVSQKVGVCCISPHSHSHHHSSTHETALIWYQKISYHIVCNVAPTLARCLLMSLAWDGIKLLL